MKKAPEFKTPLQVSLSKCMYNTTHSKTFLIKGNCLRSIIISSLLAQIHLFWVYIIDSVIFFMNKAEDT